MKVQMDEIAEQEESIYETTALELNVLVDSTMKQAFHGDNCESAVLVESKNERVIKN
jgi:hypothetical protein